MDDDEETMSRSSMLVYNGGADELKSNILLSESLGNTLAQVCAARWLLECIFKEGRCGGCRLSDVSFGDLF